MPESLRAPACARSAIGLNPRIQGADKSHCARRLAHVRPGAARWFWRRRARARGLGPCGGRTILRASGGAVPEAGEPAGWRRRRRLGRRAACRGTLSRPSLAPCGLDLAAARAARNAGANDRPYWGTCSPVRLGRGMSALLPVRKFPAPARRRWDMAAAPAAACANVRLRLPPFPGQTGAGVLQGRTTVLFCHCHWHSGRSPRMRSPRRQDVIGGGRAGGTAEAIAVRSPRRHRRGCRWKPVHLRIRGPPPPAAARHVPPTPAIPSQAVHGGRPCLPACHRRTVFD